MKSIVVVGWFGKPNFGDELLLQALLNYLNSQLDLALTVASLQPQLTAKQYSVKSASLQSLAALWSQLNQADLVIVLGGLWQDLSSTRNIGGWLLRLLPALLAHKVILLASGFNHLHYFPDRWLLRAALTKAKFISVRDQASADYLQQLTSHSANYLGSDLAWALPTPVLPTNPREIIVWNLRQWPQLKITLKVCAQVIKQLKQQSQPSAFLALAPSDLVVAQKLQKMLGYSLPLYQQFSPLELSPFWSRTKLLISQRYHGCLWAAKLGLPTLGFNHDEKMQNLFLQLDLTANLLPWPLIKLEPLLTKINSYAPPPPSPKLNELAQQAKQHLILLDQYFK